MKPSSSSQAFNMTHLHRLELLALAGPVLVPTLALHAESCKPSSERTGFSSSPRLETPVPVPAFFQTSRALVSLDANCTADQRLRIPLATFSGYDLSPDGRTIACTRSNNKGSTDRRIALVPTDANQPPKNTVQIGSTDLNTLGSIFPMKLGATKARGVFHEGIASTLGRKP